MAKYRIDHNEGVTMKRIDPEIIEAHELLLDGKIAKFRDGGGHIIALVNAKKFRIRKLE